MTATPSLPLARPLDLAHRGGRRHRRPLAVDGPVPRESSELLPLAVAATAVLLARYTGRARLVLAVPGPGGLPPRALEVEVEPGGAVPAVTRAVTAGLASASSVGDVGECLAAVVRPGDGAPAVPLTVVVGPDGVELLLDAAEFAEDGADQYARHLGRVLAVVAGGHDVAVRDVAMMPPEEERRVLVEWNRSGAPVPPPLFHEAVEGIAARTPDAVAVVAPNGTWTFAEFNGLANRLAQRLRRLGVAPGDHVGTCFPRGAESLIAQLACFKAGAAAILLDPGFPPERIRYMVENASAVMLLTLGAHTADLGPQPCPVLALDEDGWRSEPDTPVGVEVDPGDTIHICYTSGSTGVPKAVVVPHSAARNLIHGIQEVCGIDAECRGTWLAAPGYGIVEVECFSVLAAGAAVHIPDSHVVTSPDWLFDFLVRRRITHTLLMKVMAERLWAMDWPRDTALRNIRICGERVQTWPRGLPFHVVNVYGSAEATVAAMADLTELGERLGNAGRAGRTPPIGRPVANVRTYVLDEDLRPVPCGVIGELCVAGDSLSTGYLDQPEATGAKWVANPLDVEPGPVLYRTGDLARYWTDGSIEIVGRVDDLVKVRGNRVQLGEIETVLASLDGVRQAAVVPWRNDAGDVRLAAYIEPEEGGAPVVHEIRSALQRRLPAFMVPVSYQVGGLPTSTNGKIDRRNLPEPPTSRPDVDSPFVDARNDVERSLQALWSGLLDIDGVGVLDNFFDLGGDSLLAAELVKKVDEEFSAGLGVDDLFDIPNIEAMASAITGV
jgi:amino acid adenylation domain-containing protein